MMSSELLQGAGFGEIVWIEDSNSSAKFFAANSLNAIHAKGTKKLFTLR